MEYAKQNIGHYIYHLVGGFNPPEKLLVKIGPFPQVGMNIKNI